MWFGILINVAFGKDDDEEEEEEEKKKFKQIKSKSRLSKASK